MRCNRAALRLLMHAIDLRFSCGPFVFLTVLVFSNKVVSSSGNCKPNTSSFLDNGARSICLLRPRL